MRPGLRSRADSGRLGSGRACSGPRPPRPRRSRRCRRSTVTSGEDSRGGLTGTAAAELPLFRLDPPLLGSVFPVHGEDRIVLTPGDVTPLLRAAIKTVEDRRFDAHHGVDPRSILRALWADLRA